MLPRSWTMRAISSSVRLRFARFATYRTSVSVSFKSFSLCDSVLGGFAAARGLIYPAESRVGNAFRFVEGYVQGEARFDFPLRTESLGHHAKLDVGDDLRAYGLFEIAENLIPETPEVLAPEFVLDFDDQCGADQLHGPRALRYLVADRFAPCRAGDSPMAYDVGNTCPSGDNPAGLIHGTVPMIASSRHCLNPRFPRFRIPAGGKLRDSPDTGSRG